MTDKFSILKSIKNNIKNVLNKFKYAKINLLNIF